MNRFCTVHRSDDTRLGLALCGVRPRRGLDGRPALRSDRAYVTCDACEAAIRNAEAEAWDAGAHRCVGPCSHPIHHTRRNP